MVRGEEEVALPVYDTYIFNLPDSNKDCWNSI